MTAYFYDKQGQPISDIQEADRLLADEDYFRVGSDHVGQAWVSTVWLGVNRDFSGREGPPIIFETMIFGGDHDAEVWRYATEEQAAEGHAAVVSMLRGIDAQARKEHE